MSEQPVRRRLAAILVADVVGYSRLMEVDEAGTLATLKDRRKSILEPILHAHGGRTVKVMGDGVLVEFTSAVNAVAGALELQRKMAEANESQPESRRIMLRVGINLGDVIGEGGDIYGEGVNIAARLEALAEPGAVCISAKVHDEVRGKLATTFQDLGEQAVKNLSRPVHAYRVSPNKFTDTARAARPGPGLPEKPSLAVLPFMNMSGDPEQEYFADGMVEEIVTSLSRFQNLFVIARNSSLTYKGRATDIKQVGRELGVRYVLEGSVRRSGDRLRITGQLIDASTGAHLWVDRFDGALADVFDLQDQVASSVVGAITPKLEQAEIDRAKRKPTENLDAYDLYLRGLSLVDQVTRQTNEEALRLFNKATELDAYFAVAYARAAHCYGYRKMSGWMVDRDQEVMEAERLARRAIEVGRDDAIALSYGGFILGYLAGNLDDCAAYIDRALALNSNLAAAWGFSGWTRICFGEPDIAIKHAATAMRLSPLDPRAFAWQFYIALAHFCAGRYEEAGTWAEKALRDQPNFVSAVRIKAASYALVGRVDEAQKVLARVRQVDPKLRLSNLKEIMPPFRRPEDRTKFIEGLRKAGLPE